MYIMTFFQPSCLNYSNKLFIDVNRIKTSSEMSSTLNFKLNIFNKQPNVRKLIT